MKQTYFELFQLPAAFDLDETALAAKHRAIISRIHPDQYANKTAVEQRIALQWATFANEAFDTLKSAAPRAKYLLQLNAPELAVDGARVSLPPMFLMQQMEWREALEDGDVESVRAEVYVAHKTALKEMSAACAAQDWTRVQVALAQVQFVENFVKQI